MESGKVEAVRLARLGELAEVLPGFSTGAALEHDPAGTHQVVLSRHLTPGLPYSYRDVDEFRIMPKRDTRRYELRPGDVLFMSRGTRNVASRIVSVPTTTIAPVSFYILRPGPDLNAGYLTWYLNQPVAERELMQIRTGAGTPLVQRAAFVEFAIPLPDAKTQQRLAELGELMANERQLINRLVDAVSQEHAFSSQHLAQTLIARSREADGAGDSDRV